MAVTQAVDVVASPGSMGSHRPRSFLRLPCLSINRPADLIYLLDGSQSFGHHDIVLGAHFSATPVWDNTDNGKQK